MHSDDFAKAAANAVAPHGGAQRFLDAPAEAAHRKAIGAKKHGELAAGAPLAVAIDRVIFDATSEAAGAREK